MKNSKFYIFALLIVFAISSCEKDEDTLDANQVTNEMIEGEWDVESFSVNGDELLRVGSSFEMEFECTSDCKGETKWIIIENGKIIPYEWNYEIIHDGNTLELEGDNKMTIYITDSNLALSGNINSNWWEIEAKK